MSEVRVHLAVPEGQSSDSVNAAMSGLLERGWSVDQTPGRLLTLSHGDRSRAQAETDLSDANLPRDVIVTWTPATARPDDPFRIAGRPDARDVFLARVVVHLQRFGAKTVTEMAASKFGWFYVRYNGAELVQLVDQGRRLGLLAPLEHVGDAAERRVEQREWAPTERGLGVRTARGLSAGDVCAYFVDAVRKGLSAKEAVTIAIAAAGVLFGVAGAALDTGSLGARIAVVAGGLAAALVLVVGRGIVENRRMARAARSWPRGQAAFPEFFDWQRSSLREALEALGWTALLLSIGLAIITMSEYRPWLLLVTLVLLGVAVAVAAILDVKAHAWMRLLDRVPRGHRWLFFGRPFRLIRLDQRPYGWFLRRIRHTAWKSKEEEKCEFKQGVAAGRVAARRDATAQAQAAGKDKVLARERDLDARVLCSYDGRKGPMAAVNLGALRAGQGDPEGAASAYRLAIDSGHAEYASMAAFNLGLLRTEQDDLEGAASAYQLAIDSGHADASRRAADALKQLRDDR